MSALSTTQFRMISALARDRWGLDLSDRKKETVANRISSFVRKSRFASVQEYLRHLKHEADEQDMLVFFDILSTNVTSFFRDRAHFDYLEREFYTALARKNLTLPNRRIRLWSAACSTGPEPYSMAINAMDSLPNLSEWDFKILATDLSTSALRKARAATYPVEMVGDLDRAVVRKYFESVAGPNGEQVTPKPEVRRLVTIARLNLVDPWPMRGPFDVIFCRNVMIYFDAPTRENLVRRFYELLRPGGYLAVGSAETLSGLDTGFRTATANVYVK